MYFIGYFKKTRKLIKRCVYHFYRDESWNGHSLAKPEEGYASSQFDYFPYMTHESLFEAKQLLKKLLLQNKQEYIKYNIYYIEHEEVGDASGGTISIDFKLMEKGKDIIKE